MAGNTAREARGASRAALRVLRTLWIVPETLGVKVNDVEVQLSGTVVTKADAQLLEQFTARVPGVVSVDSHVSWSVGD